MAIPVKNNWLEQAVSIRNFHVQQCKDESSWTVERTAKALNRSIGSVSQYILIASWIKTHEKQLKRFDSMKEALKFIRAKQKEISLSEIDL